MDGRAAQGRIELRRPDGEPVRVAGGRRRADPHRPALDGPALRGLAGEHRRQTGSAAISTARQFKPDAVVLDVMLPDLDGFQVLRRLREETPTVPVLFLTARDAVEERIAGLTVGGDDYVTKPFSLEEVIARLRALLRRTGFAVAAGEDAVLTVGDLTLDEDSHEVRRGGDPITLTATEFELLRYLMRNPRRVLEQGADPRPGLELRLRRPGQRGRAVHLVPAQEDRRRPRRR